MVNELVMNISADTIKRVESEGFVIDFADSLCCQTTPKKAVKMLVSGFQGGDDQYYSKWMTAPKEKEVTWDWISHRLFAEVKSTYIDLYPYLKPLFGLSATSYGVSVDTLWKFEEKKQDVRSKLNDLGLKFREEFTESGWSYKFIVSKCKENMVILETLKK